MPNFEDKNMCKKLNEVSGMTPAKLLEMSNCSAESYAIDVNAILSKLGISFFDYDFTASNQKIFHCEPDNEIIGAIVLLGDDLYVFASAKCSEEEQRFIIAHELGHCCLHSATLKNNKVEYLKKSNYEDPKHENEADLFAMELLIPEDNLRTVYNSLTFKSLSVLSKIFCVTADKMRNRLDALGMCFE